MSTQQEMYLSYQDMMAMTGRTYACVTNWVYKKKLQPGVYIGNGMFSKKNIDHWIEKKGSFLKGRR